MRFYHDGSRNKVPTISHPQMGRAVKVPPLFWPIDPITRAAIPSYMPCPEDALAFSFVGIGCFVVKRGESVDLPVGTNPGQVTLESVKNAAPQLLAEDEARAAGLLDAPKAKRA